MDRWQSWSAGFFRDPLGTLVGLTLFDASLFGYRSYEHRPVLNRWSYPFFAVILAVSLCLLLVVFRSWRANRHTPVNARAGKSVATRFIDVAVLVWGVGYLIGAVENPVNAGAVTDLNFFGSISPIPALLEWLCLALLFLALVVMARRGLKGRFARAYLATGAILISCVIGEGILRIKVAIAPATAGFPTYSSAAWVRRNVKLNRAGFRDDEHRLTRSPGMRRLLVVGDSIAFGAGVAHRGDRLGEHAAATLSARTGEPWELINASLGDKHTIEEIGFLQRTIMYQPDAVVLVYAFNDIDYLAPVTPRDSVVQRGSWLNPLRVLYLNSYLFQELYVRIRLLTYRFRTGSQSDPYDDVQLVARHLEDVARFVELAAHGGAKVLVVPFEVSVVDGPTYLNRYQRFVRLAATRGIPVCSLETTFDGRAYDDVTVNSSDRHPNELANRLAASALTDCLVSVLGD